MHRITNPPRDQAHLDRLSLIFFHQPNYDAEIECLPSCVSAENPSRYGRTTSGDHITMKLTKQRAPGLEAEGRRRVGRAPEGVALSAGGGD